MTSLTDDDTGKTVRTPDGAAVGQVATVEEGTAYVETDPGILDSVKATLGWEGDREGAVAVEPDDVAEVTDDTVRLSTTDLREGEGEGGTDESVVERDEGTGQRGVGAPAGGGGSGGRTDEPGDRRHSEMDDAPPEDDRTVTKERGENESERD